MKINLKIWVGVIVLSSLIIFYRNYTFPTKVKFLFERTFDQNYIKPVSNELIENLNVEAINNETSVFDYEMESQNDSINNCKATIYSKENLKDQKKFQFLIPKTAQIKTYNDSIIYYIDKFQLCTYNRNTGEFKENLIADFKTLNVLNLDYQTVLLFGEKQSNNEFETGYFSFNVNTGVLKDLKSLEKNPLTEAAKSSLKYAGKFVNLDDSVVCYYCDKYSKIYLFTKTGEFLKEFETKDKTARPSLVSNGYAFFYERGKTFNVNNALFKMGDSLFVFSCRSKQIKYMIVDIYHYSTNQYISSSKIDLNDWTCQDIISATRFKNKVVIFFQEGVKEFQIDL